MVITKDLSRLGRDYIETGEYVEKWFPEKNVRYVSVNDGIDTFATNNGNNDIAPFKSILNDMYSKDLSKKIRTALHTMQSQGKWVGSKTALGYQKDVNDKNKLVICEEEAEIVRRIFDMAYLGTGIGEIKNYLNLNHIPTTNRMRYGKETYWSTRTIKKILTNQVYIGVTVQNKRSRINYKNRKLRANPKEQWYVVENTHPAIIDKSQFEAIQKMKIAQSYERTQKKSHFLLDGLMICYECKHKIGVKKGKGNRWDMLCNNYRKNSKLHICTAHAFNYKKLEIAVLEYIKELFLNVNQEKIQLNISNSNIKHDYKRLQEKVKNEIITLNNNLDKMYLDQLNNKINSQMYERLSKKLQNDMKQKEQEYLELEELKNNSEEENEDEIKKVIDEFLKLEEPTGELMRILIHKIEVHQDKQIDITFNFRKLNHIENQDLHF